MYTVDRLPTPRVMHRWPVLAAAVTALLLALTAGRVHAATPTLTPSENPVAFTCDGPTTKRITLAWNLGGLAKANLVITEAGNPTPFTQQLLTQTGSLLRTVTYTHNQIAELRDVSSNAILASVTISTTRPPCTIDPGVLGNPALACALVLCISQVTPNPHGTYLELAWTTSKPVSMVVEVKKNGATVSTGFSLGYVTSGTTTVFMLEPNTSYSFVATAHTQNGDDATRSGSFTTRTRKAEVTVDEIVMVHDSDGNLGGSCDCYFWFDLTGAGSYQQYGEVHMDDEDVRHPNLKLTSMNAPETLTFRAQGLDDDRDVLEACPGSIIWPAWSDSSDSCFDRAFGQRTLDAFPTALGAETKTESFSLTVTGPTLAFVVRGTLKVTYV